MTTTPKSRVENLSSDLQQNTIFGPSLHCGGKLHRPTGPSDQNGDMSRDGIPKSLTLQAIQRHYCRSFVFKPNYLSNSMLFRESSGYRIELQPNRAFAKRPYFKRL